MSENRTAVFFGVGLVAFGMLLLEVDLTRISAVTLWYYFGFVAISLALLGTGAAGVLCFVDPECWSGEGQWIKAFEEALRASAEIVRVSEVPGADRRLYWYRSTSGSAPER